MRLGVPFVISAALFAPLAYYPTYLASVGSALGSGGFWIEWLSLDMLACRAGLVPGAASRV